ncbi:MAG: hypothetical protein JO295_13610 [Verrucomicrobia bacterium]|nr:hypothetical protein [Verrucomicrobiota bacterium]
MSESSSRRHEERELLRRRIVRACYLAGGNGLTVELLREYTRTPAGKPGVAEIEEHVDYLVGKSFIAPVDKKISPVLKAWKITAEGRDYAEAEGLDE